METFDPDTYEGSDLYRQDAQILVECLDNCKLQPVQNGGGADKTYQFVWNSLTEQTPPTPHYLTPAVARLIALHGKDVFAEADTLNSEEDRGAILAAAVQDVTKLPLTLSRWSSPSDDLPGTDFSMEYASGKLYFYGVNGTAQKLAVVDDLISTGGTMVAQCNGLRERAEKVITGIVLVADKGYKGKERLERETGITPRVLAQLDLSGKRSRVSHLYLTGGEDLLKDIRSDIERLGLQFIDNKEQALVKTILG